MTKAQITDINFPTTLPGELITGQITLMNVGDEPTSETAGFFGVLIKTLWNGGEYTLFTYSTTMPGETVTFDFHSVMGGIGTMPEGNAVLEIVGRTWLGTAWRVDDVKSLDLSTGGLIPEPNPLIPILLIAGLVLLFYRRR